MHSQFYTSCLPALGYECHEHECGGFYLLIAVHLAITSTDDDTDNMKTLYKSALFIRRRTEEFNKSIQRGQGSIVVTSTLLRWIMAGPAEQLESRVRATIGDKAALTLSQTVLSAFKSKRQVSK